LVFVTVVLANNNNNNYYYYLILGICAAVDNFIVQSIKLFISSSLLSDGADLLPTIPQPPNLDHSGSSSESVSLFNSKNPVDNLIAVIGLLLFCLFFNTILALTNSLECIRVRHEILFNHFAVDHLLFLYKLQGENVGLKVRRFQVY
jgi:hypothetical protein